MTPKAFSFSTQSSVRFRAPNERKPSIVLVPSLLGRFAHVWNGHLLRDLALPGTGHLGPAAGGGAGGHGCGEEQGTGEPVPGAEGGGDGDGAGDQGGVSGHGQAVPPGRSAGGRGT